MNPSPPDHAFISYDAKDRQKALRVRQALVTATRQNVWWDRNLKPGREWQPELKKALETARCVVVLWSQHSVSSSWVLAEATVGSYRGNLVAAFLEPCELPPPSRGGRRRTCPRGTATRRTAPSAGW